LLYPPVVCAKLAFISLMRCFLLPLINPTLNINNTGYTPCWLTMNSQISIQWWKLSKSMIRLTRGLFYLSFLFSFHTFLCLQILVHCFIVLAECLSPPHIFFTVHSMFFRAYVHMCVSVFTNSNALLFSSALVLFSPVCSHLTCLAP
jgi:hypothetical protein